MFEYPVAISLSPNTDKNDIYNAVKILFAPVIWKGNTSLKKVGDWFTNYFGTPNMYLFNSGRSALYCLLKSYSVGQGDEVIVQAFTCVAVPNAVLWTGAIPVYADVDDSLNINPTILEKRISKKTKAIIVQHTFGIPAEMDKIVKIVRKHNLVLIEDCAHSLGGYFQKKKLGTFGNASFFSFGRDKVVSSVFGGAAIINENNQIILQRMDSIYSGLKRPSFLFQLQQLIHPILFSLILPFYNLNFGKFLLVLFQKAKLLSFPVFKEEKSGLRPLVFPGRYSNTLAHLLLPQLAKLSKMNERRKKCADFYRSKLESKNYIMPVKTEGAVYLRFNIETPYKDKIYKAGKDEGLLLGNWYWHTIDPKGVDYGSIGYKFGSCPAAEKHAKFSLNLPTYPRLTEADMVRIIKLIDKI